MYFLYHEHLGVSALTVMIELRALRTCELMLMLQLPSDLATPRRVACGGQCVTQAMIN